MELHTWAAVTVMHTVMWVCIVCSLLGMFQAVSANFASPSLDSRPSTFVKWNIYVHFFSEIFLGDFLGPIFGKLFSSKLHVQIGTFSGVDFLRSLPNRDIFGHIAITSQVAITCSKWPYLASGNGDLLASNGHIKSHSYLPINHHYLVQDMAIYWRVMATQNKSALLAI